MDFSHVRVHSNSQAAESANSIEARAYTIGQSIVFGAGQYKPESSEGKNLLAHELTHVFQQQGVKSRSIQRKKTKDDQAVSLKNASRAALDVAVAETKISEAKPHWAQIFENARKPELEKVLDYLDTAAPELEDGVKRIDESVKKLTLARDAIINTKKYLKTIGASEKRAIMIYSEAIKLTDEAKSLMEAAKDKGINGLEKWISKLAKLSSRLSVAKNDFNSSSVDSDKLDELGTKIKELHDELSMERNNFRSQPESVKKIHFVLRYFLAMNIPNYKKEPTLKEATGIGTYLGSVQNDIINVFGGSDGDYDLFGYFEELVKDQIVVRSAMEKALGKDPGIKPGQGDIEKWFNSMKKSSNQDVVQAYESLASGFFIHRYEADPKNIAAKQDLSLIFSRPLTISGARLAVCSDFAIIGHKLLELAGAKFQRYYIGVRASDEQIKKGSEYNDVHGLAYLIRKDPISKQALDMYVSNSSIVPTKNDGLGPGAVAWSHKNNPIYEGAGATIQNATDKALKEIEKKRESLKK